MKGKLSLFIILGLLLGIIGGITLPNVMNELSFLGTSYINILRFMIIPIIFTSVMVTIYKSKKESGKLLSKTLLTFLVMFIATFLLTSLIVWIFNPAANFTFDIVEWQGEVAEYGFAEVIANLIPSNFVTMIANNSIFACIMVAFIFGLAGAKVKTAAPVMEFTTGLRDILFKILEYIMYITPIGVFSLVGTTVANNGMDIINVGLVYIAVAYACSILTLLLVMMLPVWIYAKINPITYIKRVWKAWVVSTSTCSSAATMPYTLKVCNEEFKIPTKITNVVVPLGTTIHFCGGAVSFALLGLFCSALFGIEVTLLTYLLMILSATMINAAAPGIPGGGIVLGATYLSILGIPLSFIGLYSGFYRVLDMSYTTLNVTGDISANILLNEHEKKNGAKNAKRRVSK